MIELANGAKVLRILAEFWNAGAKWLKRFVYRPRISVRKGVPLRRLGTTYGGWTFVPTESLYGCTAVCCGLGEDASFDVAFAQEFDAVVVAVDPTPRAIAHYRAICERFGFPAEVEQSQNGRLSAYSYDLRGLDETRLQLIPKAVAGRVGVLRFFAPTDPSHVSYSLINFQNSYSKNTSFIEVETTTASSILQQLSNVQLVKLDIEGAESEAISDLLGEGFLPGQILVEFDELNLPSRNSKAKAESSDRILRAHGYTCVFHDSRSVYSYVHDSILVKILNQPSRT